MLSRLRVSSLLAGARLPSILPCACAVCGCDAEQAMCGVCRSRFAASQRPRCRCCGVAVADEGRRCGDCLRSPPAFDRTVAAVDYAPPLDQLVLALKFGNRLELAPLLADMLAEAVCDQCPDDLPSLLIAVPLGPRRLVERGFNQALEIAKPLAHKLSIRLEPRLASRERETGAQSKLHPDERRSNVASAFGVRDSAGLAGLHVGVVDDVMTTGETLNALAAVLKRAGAARVTNLVFARTPPA